MSIHKHVTVMLALLVSFFYADSFTRIFPRITTTQSLFVSSYVVSSNNMPTFVPKNHPLINVLPVEIATTPVTAVSSFVQQIVQVQQPRALMHDPVRASLPNTVLPQQTSSTSSNNRATKLQSLQEFRNYITADVQLERYTVVKFYAPWCKTCAKFGLKFNKLVSKFGDDSASNQLGPVRFAEVEYKPTLQPLFSELGVEKLPTVHIYDSDGDLVAEFVQPHTTDGYEVFKNTVKECAMKKSQILQSQQQPVAMSSEELPVVGKRVQGMSKRELLQQTAAIIAMQLSAKINHKVGNKRPWWKRLNFGSSVSD